MKDEEMTWDAWLWVAAIGAGGVTLALAVIGLFGIALGAAA